MDYSIRIVTLVEVYQTFGDSLALELVLPAGSVSNVNPSLLCDEILKLDPGAYYVITRQQLLTKDMEVFA